MTFKKALEQMKQGKKVTRKKWLDGDFLYMENNIIFCDGGFEFLSYLRNADFKANDWKLFEYKTPKNFL